MRWEEQLHSWGLGCDKVLADGFGRHLDHPAQLTKLAEAR